MKNYTLSPKALVMTAGSSSGTQPKYYENGYWYKVNSMGYEGLAERLACMIMRHSDLSDYVEYEQCMIDGRPGCRSKNFLLPEESFISFERLYNIYTGNSLSEKIRFYDCVKDRIDYTLEFIYENTGLSCEKYLSQTLTLDMLDLNHDRHFNNLGLIVDTKRDIFRCAPVFDNGAAFLSNYEKYPFDLTIDENIRRVTGQPFSANLYAQAKEIGIGMAIDYAGLCEELSHEKNNRAIDVLYIQLEYFKEIIPGRQPERKFCPEEDFDIDL